MHAKKPRTYAMVGRGFHDHTWSVDISLWARRCAFVERRGCETYDAPLGAPCVPLYERRALGRTSGADVGSEPTSLGSGGEGRAFLTLVAAVVGGGEEDVFVRHLLLRLTLQLRNRLRRLRCEEHPDVGRCLRTARGDHRVPHVLQGTPDLLQGGPGSEASDDGSERYVGVGRGSLKALLQEIQHHGITLRTFEGHVVGLALRLVHRALRGDDRPKCSLDLGASLGDTLLPFGIAHDTDRFVRTLEEFPRLVPRLHDIVDVVGEIRTLGAIDVESVSEDAEERLHRTAENVVVVLRQGADLGGGVGGGVLLGHDVSLFLTVWSDVG